MTRFLLPLAGVVLLGACGGGIAGLPQCENRGLIFYGDGVVLDCATLAQNVEFAQLLAGEIDVVLARGLTVTVHRQLYLDEPGETGLFDLDAGEIHLNAEGTSLLHELFHVYDVEVLHNAGSWRHAGWEERRFNQQDAWYKARSRKLELPTGLFGTGKALPDRASQGLEVLKQIVRLVELIRPVDIAQEIRARVTGIRVARPRSVIEHAARSRAVPSKADVDLVVGDPATVKARRPIAGQECAQTGHRPVVQIRRPSPDAVKRCRHVAASLPDELVIGERTTGERGDLDVDRTGRSRDRRDRARVAHAERT